MLFDFGLKEAPTIEEIAAKPKAIVVKGLWTNDDEHDYFKGYRYTSASDAAADINATDLDDEIRNRKCRDEDDLEDDTEYWYRFSSVDKWLNESAKSAPVSAVFRPVQDGDTDQTNPLAPGAPTLTDTPGDFAPDGSVETGLTVTITPPATGREPKKYYIEIWRRKSTAGTSGSTSGYAMWKDFTTPKLTKWHRANPLYFHKARVTPISANDVEGTPSAFTSVGVQPTDNIPVPAIQDIDIITKGSRVWIKCTLADNPDIVADPRYARTKVFTSDTNLFGGSTFDGWMDVGTKYELTNFDPGDIYVWVRNTINGSDGTDGISPRYPNTDLGGADGLLVTIPT